MHVDDEGGQPRNNQWRFDKHISIGHILTTVAIIVGAFSWGSKIESRIAVAEKTIEIQSATANQRFDQIVNSLQRIEDKLERKADRR